MGYEETQDCWVLQEIINVMPDSSISKLCQPYLLSVMDTSTGLLFFYITRSLFFCVFFFLEWCLGCRLFFLWVCFFYILALLDWSRIPVFFCVFLQKILLFFFIFLLFFWNCAFPQRIETVIADLRQPKKWEKYFYSKTIKLNDTKKKKLQNIKMVVKSIKYMQMYR